MKFLIIQEKLEFNIAIYVTVHPNPNFNPNPNPTIMLFNTWYAIRVLYLLENFGSVAM